MGSLCHMCPPASVNIHGFPAASVVLARRGRIHSARVLKRCARFVSVMYFWWYPWIIFCRSPPAAHRRGPGESDQTHGKSIGLVAQCSESLLSEWCAVNEKHAQCRKSLAAIKTRLQLKLTWTPSASKIVPRLTTASSSTPSFLPSFFLFPQVNDFVRDKFTTQDDTIPLTAEILAGGCVRIIL